MLRGYVQHDDFRGQDFSKVESNPKPAVPAAGRNDEGSHVLWSPNFVIRQ
jgi:hypothetical protein